MLNLLPSVILVLAQFRQICKTRFKTCPKFIKFCWRLFFSIELVSRFCSDLGAVSKRKSLPPGFCELISWRQQQNSRKDSSCSSNGGGGGVFSPTGGFYLQTVDIDGGGISACEGSIGDSVNSVNTINDPLHPTSGNPGKPLNGFSSGWLNIPDKYLLMCLRQTTELKSFWSFIFQFKFDFLEN